MKYLIEVDGRSGELTFDRADQTCRFRYVSERGDTDVREASVLQVEGGIYSVLLDGRSYEAKVVTGAEGLYVDLGGHRSVVQVRDPREAARAGKQGVGEGRQTVSAPMPGKVVRVLVSEGDEVKPGDGLVVVEAMKMQNEVQAPHGGTITAIRIEAGARCERGDILLEYDPDA